MASYGTNEDTQRIAFGVPDSNQDARTATARDIATTFINSKLNRRSDITNPSDAINRCANLLAAGIILSGQMTIDSQSMHPFFVQGLKLLEQIQGDDTDDADWGRVYIAQRFRGYD